MYRKINTYLEKWKNDKYRKPLIVQGARQVGKTYSILEFGKTHYDQVAYFNFQTNPALNESFAESISPSYLLPLLSRISGQTITKGGTLIVLDEIQLCERAVTSLKYFCEDAPEYHIIAAGSLLGVAVNRERFAFPVGKVDRYTMNPMDLEEFLIAMGERELTTKIRDCYGRCEPMPSVLHEAALKRYQEYVIVGGMPEAVARYAETGDLTLVRHLQDTIRMDYLDDMSKYQENAAEIKKTRLSYNTVAVQLSKKNTRFQYKLLKKGARAAEYENAIQWLVSANLISQVYRVEQSRKPLENYRDIDDFKIYLSDMGLLCAQKDLRADDIFYMEDEMSDFKGGMTENYVNIQLSMNGIRTAFWRNENGTKEVDFVVNLGGELVPIEVKSGIHVKSDSMRDYMRRFHPAHAIRISARNFGMENEIRAVPLYAVFCICG